MAIILSSIEQEFIALMSRIECITVEQAEYIIHNVLKCTENQTKKVLEYLVSRTYVSFSEDKTYIMIGNKHNKNAGKINRDVIKAMYYYLDNIQNADDLRFLCKPQSGQACIIYTKEQRLYEIVPISLESLYKISMVQQKYQEFTKSLDKNKIDASEFMPITVFIFNANDNESSILEKMEALNIDMPHILVIPQSDNIEKWMEYEEYK